jgi:hypothetical protein
MLLLLKIDYKFFNLSESFGFDDDNLPETEYPLWYWCNIAIAQQAHPTFINKIAYQKDYSEATFCHGGNKAHKVIRHDGKIALPLFLQRRTVDWYYDILCHPRET